ncbi:MAG: helix-turn-helix transcriptional regulator [Actinobacteria bacterium]|nr:helix-turn-helix transcriptional regulator [Actinomycetota bacterium]MBI3687216.1 helix-turn-helix transcriptional regulator [Actinomycetota bacterium]
MGHGTDLTIGDRIRELRTRAQPRITQRELAERAGVSIDVIRKLEQGSKHSALIGTLQRIAHALDVEIALLLGQSRGLTVDATETTGMAGVSAIRYALTVLPELADVDGEDTMLTADELRRQVTYCWGAYWAGDYPALGATLPGLIQQARATVRLATDDRGAASDLIAQVYQIAGCVVAHLGHGDLAYIALDLAMRAARDSSDELRSAALYGSYAWLVQKQGRTDEAHHVAAMAAQRIEPKFSKAAPEELSLWGSLVLTSATAAARSGRVVESGDLLSVAEGIASRLGVDRNDYEAPFGPSQVIMQAVDIAVVTNQPGHALDQARRMPLDTRLPLAARSRHMTDVAFAHAALGHDDAALDTMLRVERAAPSWISYQAFPRVVVGDLLHNERRRNTQLRELAGRLGVNDA